MLALTSNFVSTTFYISLWSKVVAPALQQQERSGSDIWSILLWWIFSVLAVTSASVPSEPNSSLVPLHPGDCISSVVASSSKPIRFDFKGGMLFPLHLKENVMKAWPCESLVQPHDDGKPPERSTQSIPVCLSSVERNGFNVMTEV